MRFGFLMRPLLNGGTLDSKWAFNHIEPMAKPPSRASVGRAARGPALHWLSGTWRTEGQLVGQPPGPETALVAVDRYEWVPGLELPAHYVAGHLGPTSIASFEVWAYDRSRRAYVSTSFDERGTPSSFEARLRGRQWTIQGKTQRFRGTFSATGDALTGTWDRKSGRRWTSWLTITLRKAGA